MKPKTTREWFDSKARDVGLVVCRWSPGDGMTRYRFVRPPTTLPLSYFSAEGSAILATLAGLKLATIWLDGYTQGHKAGVEQGIAGRYP